MNIVHPVITVVAFAALFALTACSSSSGEQFDPFAAADEGQRDILDEDPQVDRAARERHRRATRTVDSSPYDVDEAASEPARTIDANPDGWDLSHHRRIDSGEHVYDGAHNWDGPEDASFAVVVNHDESHVYFWVEVADDVVIPSDPTNLLDGVVIRLRDPQLDDLLQALPSALRDRLDVAAESAIAITPDGQAAAYDTSRSLPSRSVWAAGQKTDRGYRLEVAVGLEALPYVAALPLQQLAFRVDLYDTDDATRSSPETRMTATIRSSGEPRFAVVDTGGLRPASAPAGGPPRDDALGVWRQRDGRWLFGSLEYFSGRWKPIEDVTDVVEHIDDLGALPSICTDYGRESHGVEAYEHRDGTHRVLLSICGTAPSGTSCPTSATSQLVWTSLEPADSDRWSVLDSFQLFDEPLDQCPFVASSGNRKYHNFSLLPFDPIDTWVWGIGYQVRLEQRRRKIHETNVAIVDPHTPDFVLRDRHIERVDAVHNARGLYNSRIYLTDLNDEGGLDLCEIQEIKEQACRSLMTDCTTEDRGHEILSHVDLWNPEHHRFDEFMLARHRGCRADMGFEDFSGYKVLLIGHRLGLIRASGD